jgi:hypothetical protein
MDSATQKTPSGSDVERLRDDILAEREKGNIAFWGMPGQLMIAPLDDFITQPADGILYDLNRLEEISLTFLEDPKWVNDFAAALVIRKLKERIESLERECAELRKAAEESAEMIRKCDYTPARSRLLVALAVESGTDSR